MSNLKFADTHNMIAFLSKPTESEGFEQIATVKAKTVNGEVQLQALVDGKKVIITESIKRKDLQLEDVEGVDCLPNAVIFEQLIIMGYKTTAWNEFSSTMASAIICLATNQKFNFSKYIFESMVKNLDSVGNFLMYPRRKQRKDTELPQTSGPTTNVADEAVNEEMNASLEKATTTATSLDAEQDRGNINKTQSKATLNEPSFIGTSSGSGPRRQDIIGDTIAQTRTQRLQALEINSLKRRVTKLKRRKRSGTHGIKRLYKVGLSAKVESSDEEQSLDEEDASKQGRIADIDAAKDIYLINVYKDEDMFGVNDLDGDEVVVETEVAPKDVNLSVDEVTLAQALAALKSTKPKADKDDVQAKIDADYQLAQRLQAEEQEELTDEEKARLFVQFLEKIRKFFAAKRVEKKGTDHQQELNKGVSYMDTEVVEESSKKAEAEIAQESSSKKAGEELEQESFKKEDLEVLWRLVKARFEKIKPVNHMDNFLLVNLKTMFEHHVEDNSILYFLLAEKMYPLINHTLHQMFNDVKLQVDYECEMAFELLRLVKKQFKEGYGRIVGIKRLLDDLRVTAVKLMLLVYKLLLLVQVNAAERVTTAERVTNC
ncbi:hypothetical protein Tco_0359666 [Tanacetum coccineum]